ncbi:MAG: N-acetylmuramoyl-L-alanine amidase [Frankiales bacterium]|nr:N-acetylmuramoyl-L-alanine amidase [Frankiales bacterium]
MRLSRTLAALGVAVAVLPFLPQASASGATLGLTVLSGRPDLVSGGDALVAVTGASSTRGLRVDVDGTDRTPAFGVGPGGRVQGLLTGLRLGENVVTVRGSTGGARLTLVNHPIGGPVMSGPQIQPWACQAGARDKQCNAPTVYTFSYLPVGTAGLKVGASGLFAASLFRPYDPKSPPPPATIATTTTDTGVTVPFIVRKEVGYLDRDQYAIAALWQPGKPWTALKPQPQFNRRLVLTHGASCDTAYTTGSAPDVMNATFLAHGFVVASHALDNAGHNCNLATQAESLIMTKERVVERYGDLRWTIGSGCSGGSLVQQQVANAYPGVYQAITPQCSFTDAWSSAMQYEDYFMLLKYFQDPSRWTPGTLWTPTAIAAVLDHPNIGNPVTFTNVIPNSGDPSRSCPGVPAAQVYDKAKNPKGVKCTLQDYMVNVFGKRADGFANRPFDNTGIQYGLAGLRSGALTPAQFVDLNSHLGGLDYSGDVTAGRIVGDGIGLERAYRSGAVNSANNLDQVAIIDLRGPDPGAFHDVYRTYAMRARLLRNFGTAANQVLWRGQAPLIGDIHYADEAVLAADGWLARVAADTRKVPLAQKIREGKPGTLGDRCTDGVGQDIPSEVCDQTVVSYGTPRYAADEPRTDDVAKCQLKAMRPDDYPVTFTAGQWAALKKAFPGGVCDYSRPGVHQHGATAWLSYQDAKGTAVYGGRALGPVPTSTPLRD